MNKIILRMCAQSHEQHPRNELFRIVKTPSGIQIDLEGNIRGRGAYLSKDKSIILLAKKKHTLDKALRAQVDESIYDQLISLL